MKKKGLTCNLPPTLTYYSQKDKDSFSDSEIKVEKDWKKGDFILDIYEVKDILGQGAYGKVYRVYHHGWNMDLAVKSLKEELARDKIQRKLFVAECERWVNLELHFNILPCYYVRELGGIPRIFSEYVRGGTLEDCMNRGEGEVLEQILNYSIQCLDGLSFAHKKDLIHRDIKPANCLITEDGDLKITDFGIAAGLTCLNITGGKKSDLTKTMALDEGIAGTPAYMPPEQWSKNYGTIGPWSDIYSFGIMLYELCCRERPFDSGEEELAVLKMRHIKVAPPYPVEIVKALPLSLSNFIMKCISKKISGRPQTCSEARAELIKIYREVTGEDYSENKNIKAVLMADDFNNRAVSMIDLGKSDEAEEILESLLKNIPNHRQGKYNRGLLRWRSGKITDIHMEMYMKELKKVWPDDITVSYITGLVHLERGAKKEALREMKEAYSLAKNKESRVIEAEKILKELDENENFGSCFIKAIKLDSYFSDEQFSILPEEKEEDYNSRDFEGGFFGKSFLDYGICITSSIISPDGTYAIAGSSQGWVFVLNLLEEKCNYKFTGHSGPVDYIYLFSDGQYFLTSGNKSVCLWHMDCPDWGKSFDMNVSALFISSDEKLMLSAEEDRFIRLRNIKTGEPVKRIKTIYNIISISFSPHNNFAVAGTREGVIWSWNISAGTEKIYKGHNGPVNNISFSREENFFLSGGEDKTIRLWDLEKGETIKILKGHTAGITALNFFKEGPYALSGSSDKTLRFWNLFTGQCVRTFKEHKGTISSISLSKDETLALSGDYNGTLYLSQMGPSSHAPFLPARPRNLKESGFITKRFQNLLRSAGYLLHSCPKEGINLLKEAQKLPGYEHSKKAMDLWNRYGLKGIRRDFLSAWPVRKFDLPGGVSSLIFLPDNKRFLSGGHDGKIHLWHIDRNECIKEFMGHTLGVYEIIVSPDGRFARSAGHDKTIRLWHMDMGEELGRFDSDNFSCLSFLPDGKRILTAGHGENYLHLISMGGSLEGMVFMGHREPLIHASVLPDGKKCISISMDRTIRLWDLSDGICLKTGNLNDMELNHITVSPDCRFALLRGRKGFYLWDIKEWELWKTFEGHKEPVEAIAFSPDGRFFLSGSWDKKLCLWDIEKGKIIRTFELHTGWISSIAFSPDGNLALSGGGYEDTTLRLWKFEWDYEFPEPADWDEGAEPFLENFFASAIDIRSGESFKILLKKLAYGGYGWLKEEGVRRELERMDKGYRG